MESDREYFLKYQRRRIRSTADKLAQLRSEKGCEQCGEKHPGCLDFHHRNENEKKFNISLAASRGKRTVEQLRDEIAKCAVLCSNCHRKHHYEQRKQQWLDGTAKFSTRPEQRNGWDGL